MSEKSLPILIGSTAAVICLVLMAVAMVLSLFVLIKVFLC